VRPLDGRARRWAKSGRASVAFNHESMCELSMVGVGCRLGGLVCRLGIVMVYPAMDMGVSMTTT